MYEKENNDNDKLNSFLNIENQLEKVQKFIDERKFFEANDLYEKIEYKLVDELKEYIDKLELEINEYRLDISNYENNLISNQYLIESGLDIYEGLEEIDIDELKNNLNNVSSELEELNNIYKNLESLNEITYDLLSELLLELEEEALELEEKAIELALEFEEKAKELELEFEEKAKELELEEKAKELELKEKAKELELKEKAKELELELEKIKLEKQERSIESIGKIREKEFLKWLNKNHFSFIYVNQDQSTFAELFKNALKRPDFLILIDGFGLIAADVKNQKEYNNGYSLPIKNELKKTLTFERTFRMPVWYVYSNNQTFDKWYWINSLKVVEVGEIKKNNFTNDEFYWLPKKCFTEIITNDDFGKLWNERLPSFSKINKIE